MTRHIYFTNRREYYRRKHISQSLKIYWSKVKSGEIKRKITKKKPKIIKEKIIYFVNFRIKEIGYNINSGTGVYGSLISPYYIPVEQAKTLIKNALPAGFTPTGFYEAQDKGEQKNIEIIMYRDENDFFNEILD